jgi:cold shock CspA family protein
VVQRSEGLWLYPAGLNEGQKVSYDILTERGKQNAGNLQLV